MTRINLNYLITAKQKRGREAARRYRARHGKSTKSLTARTRDRSWRQANKARMAEHHDRYRAKNATKILRKQQEVARIQRNRDLVNSLKGAPCTDCKTSFHPCAMDFDHRDRATKTKNVAQLVFKASTTRLLAEIAKCDLVCANCHRIRTFFAREHRPQPVFSASQQLPLFGGNQ